jgi:hypothetical protein
MHVCVCAHTLMCVNRKQLKRPHSGSLQSSWRRGILAPRYACMYVCMYFLCIYVMYASICACKFISICIVYELLWPIRTCMCICICVPQYVQQICARYLHICEYVRPSVCVCVCVCARARMCVCIHTCIYACLIRRSLYIDTGIICMHINVCVCIYTHTHFKQHTHKYIHTFMDVWTHRNTCPYAHTRMICIHTTYRMRVYVSYVSACWWFSYVSVCWWFSCVSACWWFSYVSACWRIMKIIKDHQHADMYIYANIYIYMYIYIR